MGKIISIATTLFAATLASASVATAQTQTERFSLIDTSVSAAEPVFSVIATGAFADGGTAEKEGKGTLVLKLSAGTVTLRTDDHVTSTNKSETATTCLQTQAKRGSYTLVGGTGAYKGITGSGHATDDNTFVEALVHGDCSNSFAAVQGVIIASGPVSLP